MEENLTLTLTSESVQHKSDCNSVDRISKLPDEILASMVSLLPLKEAVATSVLSTQCRYAWTSTRDLDFDAGKALRSLINLKPKSLDRQLHRYVDCVNRVVEKHTGPDIRKFRVCFCLDYHFASSIDRWVQFAMNKRVEVLELDLFKLVGNPFEDLYSFPLKLLKDHNIGMKSLKVLYLEGVDVTDEDVEYLLSHCPVLERLSVRFTNSLTNVRVVGPSVGLKYLELKLCYELTKVEIRDTNLVSFIYRGGFIELILSNVPFLIEVSADCDFLNPNAVAVVFTQLSSRLSQLESLMMDIFGVKYNENYVLPVLENLKNLELTIDQNYKFGLSQLSSFMKASPSLQRLVLRLHWSGDQKRKIRKAATCPHYNLRVVEVAGYLAHANVDEHVMYLIENAVGLEKIVIDSGTKWMSHHTGADLRKIHLKREAKARSHAMHWLKAKVHSSIEFVCL